MLPFPPDKGGGTAGIGLPIRYFEPQKPAMLPGGVSMKEFAKTWVDNGDWPLSIQSTLGYGGIVSLMR